MYEVVWTPKSENELKELPVETIKRIVSRVEQIKYTPYHFTEHLVDIKAWRLRVGDYRLILDIDEEKKTLYVLKVGHRRNIYKNIK